MTVSRRRMSIRPGRKNVSGRRERAKRHFSAEEGLRSGDGQQNHPAIQRHDEANRL